MRSNEVIRRAFYYIGYMEKKSDFMLDSFTKNAGVNNFNKFAKAVKGVNARPWCCYFQQAIFKEVEKDAPAKLLKGVTGSCSTMLENMQKFIVKDPKRGDLVFFREKVKHFKFDMAHVGLVIGVDDERIYTIEGNTSSIKDAVVPNGGMVAVKSYRKDHDRVDYYVRPAYDKYTTPFPSLPSKVVKKGSKGMDALKVQCILNYLGVPDKEGHLLETDSSCGAKTTEAIEYFQRAYGLVVDGSFGPKSKKKAKELLNYE